jgi:hypothetical protein
MDAAFMLLVRHERGIHALRFGTGGARVTEVRPCVHATPYRASKQDEVALWPE